MVYVVYANGVCVYMYVSFTLHYIPYIHILIRMHMHIHSSTLAQRRCRSQKASQERRGRSHLCPDRRGDGAQTQGGGGVQHAS